MWYVIGIVFVFLWSTFLALWLGRRVQTAFSAHHEKDHTKEPVELGDSTMSLDPCFKCEKEVNPACESFYTTKGGRITCHDCVVKGYRELRRRHKDLKYSAKYLVDIMDNQKVTNSSLALSMREDLVIQKNIGDAKATVVREFRRSNNE